MWYVRKLVLLAAVLGNGYSMWLASDSSPEEMLIPATLLAITLAFLIHPDKQTKRA